ncbi:MAG: ThuA domain-containing protein [Clostridia bacterium]|nr:ThuA domain-containing protein [Clostridia bacterium]MBQ4575724.1 ThuA domain-containing protein [Clostridia bacterium]
MSKALIFQGGWDGHEPKLTSARFAAMLEKNSIAAEVYDNQECLADLDKLLEYDLIVACWTMGTIDGQYSRNVAQAVGRGVGLAGCHGGMCDAFRQDTEWQFMTGGQWVSHPGGDGIEYTVNICHGSSPITEGLEDFPVKSEHYYLHIDPSIEVLATTRFPLISYYHASNKPVDMPVAWTKYWGLGRVFYTSLGHHDDVFDNSPNAAILMERGMLWAAGGKAHAEKHGLTVDKYLNNAKMY